MRSTVPALFITAFAVCLVSPSIAQQEVPIEERIAARMELTAAKSNLRYYWQVEYPRQLRMLDQAIEMTRTDIENNKRLLRQYRPFTRFSLGQPFPITISQLESCIQATEFRLNELIAERDALVRFRSDQFNQLAFQVTLARQRVLELEPPLPEESQATPAQR